MLAAAPLVESSDSQVTQRCPCHHTATHYSRVSTVPTSLTLPWSTVATHYFRPFSK